MRWPKESHRACLYATMVLFLSWLGYLSAVGFLKVVSLFLASLSIGILVLLIIFFRDPERECQASAESIISPADGRVTAIEETEEKLYFQGPARRIAIFMHLGNVHVQRIPAPGRLLWIRHFPGHYYSVLDPKASRENEQRWYAFSGMKGKYVLVQIAGLIARRTISWIQPDKDYQRGERLGMIAFGSEIDLYLPLTAQIKIQPGDKLYAGQTIIGAW